jgi:lipopolysaccharide transport system ATP-binding protein
MGVRRRDADALIDDISEFTELGEYLNMPLRTYSSGMAMRLAFAISTSVSADIILMDEWLSAGDAAFAQKARDRLAKVVGEAKILVLASHQLDLIKAQCNRVVGLDHGKINFVESLAEFQQEISRQPVAATRAV